MKLYIFNCIDRGKAIDAIQGLENGYTVEIKKVSTKRSLSQNKLYWRWLDVIGNELGYHREDVHEIYKDMFLIRKEVMGRTIAGSTRDCNTKTFTDYLDKIQIHAASELGINLPTLQDI